MTEDEQRRFGINKNLLKTKVPTHYGKGEHKVKLAYITEPEAKILKELDLYGSNPPHEGPGGIPNYNDSGGTAGGQGKQGGFGGKNKGKERDKRSLKDRIAARKKAGTFKATTPTADFKPDFDEQAYLKSQFLTDGGDNFVTNNGQRIKTPGAFENYLDREGIVPREKPQEFQGFQKLFSGIAADANKFMNSPLGNLIGLAVNPAGFIGGQALKNIYGAYSDEDDNTGIISALGNTYRQSTPFDEVGSFFNKPEQIGYNTSGYDFDESTGTFRQKDINGNFVGEALTSGNTLTPDYDLNKSAFPKYEKPSFFDNVRTDYNNTKDFFGNLFSGLDIQPNDLEAERRANRGPGDGPRIPLPGDPDYVIPLPDASKGTGGPGISPPPNFELFGSIDPAPNYNLLYGGGFANGGQVPPMSGPMSNGIGNLFKMK